MIRKAAFCAIAATAAVMCSAGPALTQTSFECSAARSANEKFICGDSDLIARDRKLMDLYKKLFLVTIPEGRQTLAREQQAWLKKRNACGTHYMCTASAYGDRLAELNEELDH